MARSSGDSSILMALPGDSGNWRRRAIQVGVPILAALVVFVIFWKLFFRYVPPGHHLVVISKNGDPLTEGEVLADRGQKGIQREVLGEGYHFVWPIIYSTELKTNTVVPPGNVGIVTALGGK